MQEVEWASSSSTELNEEYQRCAVYYVGFVTHVHLENGVFPAFSVREIECRPQVEENALLARRPPAVQATARSSPRTDMSCDSKKHRPNSGGVWVGDNCPASPPPRRPADSPTRRLPPRQDVEVCCKAFGMHEGASCATITATWDKNKSPLCAGRRALVDSRRRQSSGETKPAAPSPAWAGCMWGPSTCVGMAWQGSCSSRTRCSIEFL